MSLDSSYNGQPASGKPMDEQALISAIDDSDNRSYGSNLSNLTAQLSAERALNIDLYLGKNVDPAPEGQSNVVDRTVFETVQWILPSLCNIFANGDDVCTLAPDSLADVEPAKQEAAYLNWLVTQDNDWFSLFLEWATDMLLTKNAYMLVFKDRSRKVQIEKYEKQTKEGISLLLQDPEVSVLESKSYPAPDLPPDPVIGPQGAPVLDGAGQPVMTQAMLYDVTIRRANTGDKIGMRSLPPERVKVDQRTFSWRLDERCNYFEYWEELTLSELREQGFDISDDIADDPELYTQEDYARDQYGERRLERYKPSDPSMRRVKARMIWIRVDYDGDGEAELLQVLRVGRRILYMEEVSRIPVASAVAIPVPHRHIGISAADITSDIQRIKTAVLRQGLDNLYLSNNPQKVVNEQMVNLDDALISRAGGLIRATDINQIRYENMPFVFPQAMEALQYMDTVRQNRTGVNNSFSGIDTKELANIQPQTVNQVSSMAAQRVELMARIIAFAIEDLFAIVHEHVLKMGHKRQTLQLQGKWVEVDPGAWKSRNKFKICVAFAAGNKDAQIARLMGLAAHQLGALQAGVPVVTPENYFVTLTELTKASGLSAPERFWTDPQNIPPKPPQPPPELLKQAMVNHSNESMTAAKLIQQDVESRRKAEVDKYAVDANVGLEMMKSQQDHEHSLSLSATQSHHQAALAALQQQFAQAEDGTKSLHSAVADAHKAIEERTASLGPLHQSVSEVMAKASKALAMAGGRRVIKKDAKGIIQGVDILDDDGKVLASHKAVHDEHGRVTGLQ